MDVEPAQLEAERPSGDTQEEDEVEAAIAHGDVAPYGDLAQSTLRPPGRALFTFTEIEIEPVHDWHGDQSSGLERCPPDLHPTMDAKYFNGKELHMRDPWSRDLNPQELFKKDWSQQYEHNRRFLLMGGFGKGGVGCQDMWELRLYTRGLSFTVCEEGSTFSLPPGTCGKVEEAFYGQRTSFIDVTELLQSLVREDYSLEDVLVENESFGIIDRHEDLPEKRWRDHVEEWTREVGNQDPLPGVDKKLVVKYHKPPGSSERYKWSKIPPSPAPRSGSALKPVIGHHIPLESSRFDPNLFMSMNHFCPSRLETQPFCRPMKQKGVCFADFFEQVMSQILEIPRLLRLWLRLSVGARSRQQCGRRGGIPPA